MTRDRRSRAYRRFLVAFLAVWMGVFAVITTVHNHGLPEPTSKRAVLDQSGAKAVQVGTCFACLASRVPVSAPAGPVVVSAPCLTAEAPLPEPPGGSGHDTPRSLSSRAPPLSTRAA